MTRHWMWLIGAAMAVACGGSPQTAEVGADEATVVSVGFSSGVVVTGHPEPAPWVPGAGGTVHAGSKPRNLAVTGTTGGHPDPAPWQGASNAGASGGGALPHDESGRSSQAAVPSP
jgi:hypothetical protein